MCMGLVHLSHLHTQHLFLRLRLRQLLRMVSTNLLR